MKMIEAGQIMELRLLRKEQERTNQILEEVLKVLAGNPPDPPKGTRT